MKPLLRHAAESLGVDASTLFVEGGPGGRLVAAGSYGPMPIDPSSRIELARRAIAVDEPCRSEAGRFSRDAGAGLSAAAPVHPVGGGAAALWIGSEDPAVTLDADRLAELPGLAEIAGTLLDTRVSSGGIDAMAALLNLRDGYAAADAEQMVELAVEVGRQLEMPPEDLAELNIAARLHDIGKIGVPDRILHKPGRLDEDDRLVMQRHPVWGAETLSRVPGLERVAEAVRSHHERWDGAGYPAGLASQSIPLASRIIGVCEAFRAMTSERPYRRAVDAERAVEVIRSASGSHFDPRVGETLTSILRRRGVVPTATKPPNGRKSRGHIVASTSVGGYGKQLATAFKRMDALPALTESRDRLLQVLAATRPSATEIVAAVESDLALVIAVLRIASRGAARKSRMGSVPEAVAALTPEGVEMLASRIGVVDFFDPAAGWSVPTNHVRTHALAVQRAADHVAREAGWRDREELRVAALLHDVGKLALAYAASGYPAEIHGDAGTPDERLRAERHALGGLDHAAVGGVLVRRWGLAESVAVAVEHHHDDHKGDSAAVIRLADMLVHHQHGRPIDIARLSSLGKAAGLDAAALRALMHELPSGPGGERRTIEPCPLTTKELEVMRYLSRGLQYKEIGTALGLATSTVRSHLHKVYTRLGVADRAQAVLLCKERGWV